MYEAQLPAFELAEREPATIELARKLLEYMLSGAFQPGQKLPSERQLADALSIGRAAIREALKALTLLGIVQQRHGGGTYLSSSTSDLLPRAVEWGLLLGEKKLEDLIELRTHLEPILAELAAQRRTDDDLRDLRSRIATMSTPGIDHTEYVESDVQFHLAIGRAAHNEALSGVLSSVHSLLNAWTTRVIRTAGETETSLAMHTPILKAVEARNAGTARTAMKAHMERANMRLRASIEAHQRETCRHAEVK